MEVLAVNQASPLPTVIVCLSMMSLMTILRPPNPTFDPPSEDPTAAVGTLVSKFSTHPSTAPVYTWVTPCGDAAAQVSKCKQWIEY